MKPRLPYEQIRSAALAIAPQLLREWLPHGRRVGNEFKCGNIRGEPGDSFSFNLATGAFADFADDRVKGSGLIDLRALMVHGGDPYAAALELGELAGIVSHDPIPGMAPAPSARATAPATPASWTAMVPPPPDAPEPDPRMFDGFDHVHEYKDQAGRTLFYQRRRNARDGQRRMFTPLSYGSLDGKLGWHPKAPAAPRPLYGMDRLAGRPNAPVLVVEGEKAADAASFAFPDWVAVTWHGGANAVDKTDFAALAGRRVIIWPDNDAPGHAAAAKIVAALSGALVLRVDDLEEGADAADVQPDDPDAWIRDRLAGEEPALCRLADATPTVRVHPNWRRPEKRLDERGDDNRPTIRWVPGDLERIVNEAEAALIAAGRGVYQRDGRIVGIGETRSIGADKREVGGQRIFERGEFALLEDLTAAANFERFDGRGKEWISNNAPMTVVKALQQRLGRWNLPVLAGVINAPTLRADGSILSHAGYDEGTGLVLDPRGVIFPAIPEYPTRADAEKALSVLRDLISTFPMVSSIDQAVALSAILTATIRRSLRTAPLHGFTAPAPGSGKSLLVDIASVISVGREAGVIAQGHDEAEFEKRLGSVMLAGDPVVAIDNCEAPLGGEFLCQVLTQTKVRTRVLGKSETPELSSNAFITATGNNLTLMGDMTRRAVLCRLDANEERPELRVFEREPITMIKADRGKYIAAALTVLRAYHVAGRPKLSDPLGSFADWSAWVRGALLWLGDADPVSSMGFVRALDPKQDALASVLSQWRDALGSARVTVRSVIEKATELTHPDFREALLTVAGAAGSINSRRLGIWLAANKNRIVDGCKIVQAGIREGITTWQLVMAAPATLTPCIV